MPRVAGVSFSSTVCRIRRRPRLRTTVPWLLLKPIGLLSSVTLTVPPFLASVRWLGMLSLFSVFPRQRVAAAHARDQCRVLQRMETRDGCADDVMRVGRP